MTLEELKAKRKEIDCQIKELQSVDIVKNGIAKIDKHHYPTGKEIWYLAVRTHNSDASERPNVWRSIYNDADRQKVVDSIATIIDDLIGLKEKIEKGGLPNDG